MLSTPKYSRPSSRDSSCRGSDISVAPYLTHVVTHHGQITLVPPQNQGRLRKKMKIQKEKPTQLQPPSQESVQALPRTVRSASRSNSKFLRPRKQKQLHETSRSDVANTQISSRGSLAQSQPQDHPEGVRLVTSLPSSNLVRSDITRATDDDVIFPSSPSSSSDEFEDITEADLESQWELDRMVGLTLEERVQREWHRQQAAIDMSQHVTSCTQRLTPTETDINAKGNTLMAAPNTSGSSTRTVVIDGLKNASQSSLGDWDLLEPSSHPFQTQKTSTHLGASEPIRQEPSISDVESLSSMSSSLHEECLVPDTGTGYESRDYMSSGDHLEKCETDASWSDAEGRDISDVGDGKRLSLIHNRPLPTPPVSSISPKVMQTPEASTSKIPSQGSTSTSSSVVYAGTSSSVRDRITKFESMRNRPVPSPPSDFLRTRVKRKPPPPPPSSDRPKSSVQSNLRPEENDLRHQGTSPISVPSSFEISNRDMVASQPRDIPRVQNLHPQRLQLGSSSPRISSGLSRDILSHSSEVRHANDTASPAIVCHDQRDSSQVSTHETPDVVRVAPSAGSLRADTTLSQFTDFDVLLSRLDDETSSGSRYEDLLLVSDILGPARPESPTLPLTQPQGTLSDLLVGKIEVVRRRKLQDGRVKLKLSLLGLMVDRCQVCLSQFKDEEWAALLPCFHSYHSTCLQSWLRRSHTCPLCRVSLDKLD